MKTTHVELKEVTGPWDGKIKVYRDPDNTLVLLTNSQTLKIKNGTLYLTGNIVGQNYQLGTPTTPLVLLITDTSVTNDVLFYQIGNAIFGDVGEPGLIKICDTGGSYVFIFDGATGHATIKGGLNVGTATGATPGDGKFSGIVTADTDAYPVAVGYNKVAVTGNSLRFCTAGSGDILFNFYEKLSSNRTGDALIRAYGSAADTWTNFIQMTHTGDSGYGLISTDVGKIRLQPADGNVEIVGDASFNNGLCDRLKLLCDPQGLPTASSIYSGQFRVDRDPAGVSPDKLYICLRDAQAAAYHWILVAQGQP